MDLLRVESLGNFTAVFDPDTGETHFLNDLPALLLSEIGPEPVNVTQLTERLTGRALELDRSAERHILASLAFLERAELVESVDPD